MQKFNKIIITEQDKYILVDYNEVRYFEANGPYCTIHWGNSKSTISKSLKQLEDILNNELFVRIHQSYLVNINQIKSFYLNGKSSITFQNNESLVVSRNFKKKLRQKLEAHFEWL